MKGYAEKRRLLRFEKETSKPRTEKEKAKTAEVPSSTQKEIV